MPQAQTWYLRSVDTQGEDLILSRLLPWAAGAAVLPVSIAASLPPLEGSVDNLLQDDDSACRFAAKDVASPGFYIAVTFASAVEVWGFRFAGPSATTWIRAHILVAGAAAADLGGIRWQAGELSPAPRSSATFDDIEVGKTTPWNNLGVFESYGVAVSDARSVIAVGGHANAPRLSKDGGATWVALTQAGTLQYARVGMSGDANTILFSSYGGYLMLSKNAGTTFVAQTAVGASSWEDCTVSADGLSLYGARANAYLARSIDGGANWGVCVPAGSRQWVGVAVSDNGSKVLATVSSGSPWMSSDGGVTFAPLLFSAAGARAAVSGNGDVLGVAPGSAAPWLSTDGGVTWRSVAGLGVRNWAKCAIDSTGNVIAFLGIDGFFAFSCDKGETWVSGTLPSVGGWYALALSRDGRQLIAGGYQKTPVFYYLPDTFYQPRPGAVRTEAPLVAVKGSDVFPVGSIGLKSTEVVDVEFGGHCSIHGTVELFNQAGNLPLPRRVRLHRSRDGLLVRETWSNTQGQYRFDGISQRYTYDVIAWDHEGLQRSVVANDLTPEVMP
ncbi:hypothetical protein N7340_17440 [Comamonas aquatica]|uniref:sialidase family protein n=1 Tax=Comamonas aquatica TaxID=225991 RepID=UPI00244B8550|nr:hypothetical protein [Comamonas aquatica]MDH0373534.1 hypothetical protein [Comamonas aquatica]